MILEGTSLTLLIRLHTSSIYNCVIGGNIALNCPNLESEKRHGRAKLLAKGINQGMIGR
jgi:hypothetical protein